MCSPWTVAADTRFRSGLFFETVAGGTLARENSSTLLSWDGAESVMADDCADRNMAMRIKAGALSRANFQTAPVVASYSTVSFQQDAKRWLLRRASRPNAMRAPPSFRA